MATNIRRGRGRPRRFDPDAAVATAQRLFQARGFDAVSIADVTDALGINPPSFYAAFGNKIGLFKRILDRYAVTDAIPFFEVLRQDRPIAEALSALLEEAARRYVADPAAAGCLVQEGTRCLDREARELARSVQDTAEASIRSYIAARHPKEAERLTDFVVATMAGLSARARAGQELERLLSTARLAGLAITQTLAA